MAAIVRVPNVDAAVEAANASQFGLSGNLWTKDVESARKIARDLDTGGVFINGVTASDPRVPVGGVKNSGYGREPLSFRSACVCQRANRLDRESIAMRGVAMILGSDSFEQLDHFFGHASGRSRILTGDEISVDNAERLHGATL